MPVDILLPILGESISNAVLLSWRKKAGEAVKLGEIIAELETEKASMELESPASGVLYRVFVEEGVTVSTGQQLAVVLLPGEKPGELTPPAAAPVQPGSPPTPGKRVEQPKDRPLMGAERRVSPAARKMAQDLSLDISLVPPGRPGARVSTDDVQRYVDALASTPSKDISLPYHLVTMNEVRKIIARRMTESAQTIPQFSVTTEVEMDAFKRALQAVQPSPGSWPNRISITALLIYLIARALAEHPLVNAHYAPEGILVFDTINLAVAVSTERGLVAPVIHHVENLALAGLAGQLVELVQRSKEGSLVLDDLTAGTFTMSNLGMYGVTQFIPLVNPPQAAILGVGAIQPTLVPLAEGRTRQVSRMSLSLSADHRVLDGSEAAGFLATLKIVIEQCTPAEINI